MPIPERVSCFVCRCTTELIKNATRYGEQLVIHEALPKGWYATDESTHRGCIYIFCPCCGPSRFPRTPQDEKNHGSR